MLDAVAVRSRSPVRARVPAVPPHRLPLADAGPLHWLLRIACCAEFVGHGAFGILTKAAWLPYFGVVGIPPELAWKLMPLIGSVDITLGLLTLIRPSSTVLLYMACWGLLTATIRPLAGEPIWEFVEPVPNWAVPLTFLAVRSRGRSGPASPGRMRLTLGNVQLDRLLRVAVRARWSRLCSSQPRWSPRHLPVDCTWHADEVRQTVSESASASVGWLSNKCRTRWFAEPIVWMMSRGPRLPILEGHGG